MKEKFVEKFNELFIDPKCELEYSSNFELLVAVILSAQCTDKRVNQVTRVLFEKYNKPQDFASLQAEELEEMIHSCGFFRAKAKAIIEASKDIVSKFGGTVESEEIGLNVTSNGLVLPCGASGRWSK